MFSLYLYIVMPRMTVYKSNKHRGKFRSALLLPAGGKHLTKTEKEDAKQIVHRKIRSLFEKHMINRANPASQTAGVPTSDRPSTTMGLEVLNLSTQGVGQSFRIGNRIRITRLQIRFHLQAGDTSSFIRLMLFWDKKPAGAIPVIADLFQNTTVNEPTYNLYNEEQVPSRFKMIKDKVIPISAVTATIPTYKTVKWNISFKDKEVIYGGNAGTIADLKQNALELAWFSNLPAGGTGNPNLKYTYKLYFEDA